MRILLLLMIVLASLLGCSKKAATLIQTEVPSAYTDHLAEERKARVERLTAPQGWLSVVGLYWMEEGINTIGASDDNTIVFPRIKTETIGAYQKNGDDIFFGKIEGVEVQSDGQEYMGGDVIVGYPHTVVNHGSLYWYVMKRGERHAIRLKDTLSEHRMTFQGIPYYADDMKYKVHAKVTVPEEEQLIDVTNVLGATSALPVAALLTFNLSGTEHTLSAFDEGGETYFVVFGDATNGVSSYGGGRFLYPKKPEDGHDKIVLDFNLSVNPPCAFTDFATCPLPPSGNVLDVPIEAGEKAMPGH